MSFIKTEHERNSAIITTVIMIVLLLLMIFFGMTYLDPPEESGIAVNFGTTETGSGNVQPKEALKPDASPSQPEKEIEDPQETETVTDEIESDPQETDNEEVVTQDSEEAIAIKKAEEAKKRAAEEAKRKKAEADRIAKEKREAEEKRRREEAKKRAELDAMMDGVKNSDGNADGGEGDDNQKGDKGNPDGDPYANSYYGQPGSGNGGTGGYGLNGRTKLSGGQVDKQDCNEAGRVVVKITVNKAGKVINAVAGVKGTTNNAQCLLAPAEEAAYRYRWNADDDAPSTQIGFIVVNFKLGQ